MKLVMKEMHSRGQMLLSDRDVQQVYTWQLMPHIASEVTPLVDAIVHSLSVSFRRQTTPWWNPDLSICVYSLYTRNRPLPYSK